MGLVRILDLYCGIGGLSLGFALGVEGVEILGLDVDRWAVSTYNLNLSRFGCRAVVQNVLVWEPGERFDIVIGGSPCQPFSTSSRVMGANHRLFPTFPRFFELVLRIAPLAFVFENVRGLLSRRMKPYLDRELDRVRKEYRVVYGVLNAARYGVPQRRERLVAIGVRRDLGIEPSLPPETHGVSIPAVTMGEAIGDLINAPLGSVPDHVAPPLTPQQIDRIVREREDTSRHFAKMLFPDPLDKPSRTVSSHTVEGSKRETIVILCGSSYRRLTVRECLRLQSFPDWWRFPSGASLSKRYRLVGEAVPPILAYRIATHLAKILGLRPREPPRYEEWSLPYFHRAFADYLAGRCPNTAIHTIAAL